MSKLQNPLTLDANETAFFTRQLEYVKSRTFDVKHINLKAPMLVPVSTDAPSGSDTITYRSFDQVGIAKIISDYAHDFPRVDVYGTEKTAKVRSIGDSYGYSIKEIRRSQLANTQLDTRRAAAARRAIDEKLESLAWAGDSKYAINGLLDYPGITSYTIPNGASGFKAWSTKTPDELIADVSGLVNAVTETTNGREAPNTLLLPLAQYNILANTRVTDGDSKTVLTFILENNPHLEAIEWLTQLKGVGVAGADRAFVYTRDPEHLTLEVPQAFEQFPVQWTGMEAEVPCHMETAGVIVYYPLSIAFGDGI